MRTKLLANTQSVFHQLYLLNPAGNLAVFLALPGHLLDSLACRLKNATNTNMDNLNYQPLERVHNVFGISSFKSTVHSKTITKNMFQKVV